LAGASPAAAQEDDAARQSTVQQMMAAGSGRRLDTEARARFGVGQSLYTSGRFAESAREFEAAYELSHRPELLFNIYVANRDDNDLEKAVPALRAYLAAMPSSLPNRINLEARLQAMDATLAERAAQAEASAQQAAEIVAAHERAAAAEAAQRSAERAVRPPAEPRFRLSLPGVVIGGAGIAAAIGGFVAGGLVLGKVSELEASCPGNRCPATARATYDSAQTLVTVADVLLIGGAVLAAGGLVMVLLRVGTPREEEARVAPVASCGPTGCLAGVEGTF
jgi:tetratricopeptide (TPR) repeat protein